MQHTRGGWPRAYPGVSEDILEGTTKPPQPESHRIFQWFAWPHLLILQYWSCDRKTVHHFFRIGRFLSWWNPPWVWELWSLHNMIGIFHRDLVKCNSIMFVTCYRQARNLLTWWWTLPKISSHHYDVQLTERMSWTVTTPSKFSKPRKACLSSTSLHHQGFFIVVTPCSLTSVWFRNLLNCFAILILTNTINQLKQGDPKSWGSKAQ